MKSYKFEVDIFEGSDEFWEKLGDKSGCNEVQDAIISTLNESGFIINKVVLKQFTDEN